jgi:hypothetical protein
MTLRRISVILPNEFRPNRIHSAAYRRSSNRAGTRPFIQDVTCCRVAAKGLSARHERSHGKRGLGDEQSQPKEKTMSSLDNSSHGADKCTLIASIQSRANVRDLLG